MVRCCIYMLEEEEEKMKRYCETHQDPIWHDPESRSNVIRMALEEFYLNHGFEIQESLVQKLKWVLLELDKSGGYDLTLDITEN